MDGVDVKAILSGTDQKVFDQRYQEMKENFNEDTAKSFLDSYKGKPLSFILKNAKTIIKEPYFGVIFFNELVENYFIPFHKLEYVKGIIDEVVKEAQKNNLWFEQEKLYNNLLALIYDRNEKFKNTKDLYTICINLGGEEYIETFYQYIYEIEKLGSVDEVIDLVCNIDCPNAYVLVSITILLLLKYYNSFDLSWSVGDILSCGWSHHVSENEEENIEANKKFEFDKKRAICIASKDEAIMDVVALANPRFKKEWYATVFENMKKPSITIESVSSVPIFSPMDLMTRMIEESADDTMEGEEIKCKKFDYFKELRSYYESQSDYIYLCSELGIDPGVSETYEECTDHIGILSDQISMLEWTEDGEPDPVIKNHIMTRKQKEKATQKSVDEKKEIIKKSIDKEIDEEDFEEKEPSRKNKLERKKVYDLVIKAIRTIKDTREHVVADDKKKFEEGKINSICLGSFKKESVKEVVKVTKTAVKPFKDFTISEDNYFTVYLDVKRGSDFFVESTNDENKLEEPKEDLPTRIQNKAIDHEAKRQEKKSLKKERNTKLKNAGKAVMAGPKDWEKDAETTVSKLNKWDENRRKKFFLKPGYRHKIFRNMKHALMYGVAAKAKITMIPLTMLIRHFSKDKDRRIRNELIRELDTEIRICEEKINDANSNGDQQEKYKLMRIKDKLNAEKQRVQLNSKYI